MIDFKKHAPWISLTVVGAVAALAVVVPGSGVFATEPQPEGKAACADLTSELTGILDSVTKALVPQVTIPPALPDLSKATGLVGKLTTTATNLVNLGCLPDPATAVAVPIAGGKMAMAGLPIPSLPVPGLPLPSSSAAPELPGAPGVPGAPAVPACAAPAAGLLSLVFGLLQTLLKLVGGAGVPDVSSALTQVTGLQSTVTDLTTSKDGATSCLPAAVPVRR
jgi:hypothetical protein